jgi:serine/threonine-protein kinase HipA
MGNGDAHIKNWSLIYDNPLRPRLAPAYDLVSTVAYTTHDTSIALNMVGVKLFRNITLDTFDSLFTRIGLVDRIRDEVMEEVRTTGRQVLETWQRQFQAVDVPEHLATMIEQHQAELPLTKVLKGDSNA